MNKVSLYITNAFFLIENGCLNCFKIVRIKDYKKIYKLIFFVTETYITGCKYKEETISPAVSTGQRRRRPLLDGAVDL